MITHFSHDADKADHTLRVFDILPMNLPSLPKEESKASDDGHHVPYLPVPCYFLNFCDNKMEDRNTGGIPMFSSLMSGRPSPLPAPTLRHKLWKRIRQSPYKNYYNEQLISGSWEPLGESQQFQYTSMEEPKQGIMGSILPSKQEPWIRLLKLSSLRSMKTHYELVTVQFHEHPPYKAISYAWGDPTLTKVVSVFQDNCHGRLKVPINLRNALIAMQHKTEDVFVWADSVCINQKDNNEKTQQLSRIPDIYGKAEKVVVWLGVEKNQSDRAQALLRQLAHAEVQLNPDLDLSSVVSLFDRDYWNRLWVVQEILHARHVVVQCGSYQLSWDDYMQASKSFQLGKGSLTEIPSLARGRYNASRLITSQHRLSPLQILVHHGPASILHVQEAKGLYGDDSSSYLLHLMRISRTKLASDPKDRLYGILGILPDEIRSKLRVNYLLPVKQIYIDVVEVLLESGNMDVICESIHFPHHINNEDLPSWVPDWSYDPMARSLASLPLLFSAGSRKSPYFSFDGETLTRSRLLIAGVRIGTIQAHGMAVNTHSRAADYCMAFLQWRALLLQHFAIDCGSLDDTKECRRHRVTNCDHQQRFCLTLSLGQPLRTDSGVVDVAMGDGAKDTVTEWVRKCYGVFAKMIRARLPLLPIDEDMAVFAELGAEIEPENSRQFLQDSFAEYMMGRCFCILDSGDLGLGSGAMARGDVVVVPYGCSTPVLLRPEWSSSEGGCKQRAQSYRFIGDAYIHGYMDGEAMEQGSKEKFVLF